MTTDWDQHEEFNILPEHTEQSEYTPEYPDVSFFKESAVTAREENVFQGEAPRAETGSSSARREKRRKKTREYWLRNLLGAAVRGGAVLLATGALVSTLVLGQEQEPGSRGEDAAEQLVVLQRKAFKHPVDYTPKDLAALWAGDQEAPHQYDMQTPYVRREADCEHDGLVEYLCTECGLALQYPIPGGHKEAPAITENIIEPTCTQEGHFDSVVYCSVCHKELSRKAMTVAARGHTPAEAVKENETAPACTVPGSYEEVTYCSLCHEELSRNEVAVEAPGHTPAEAVAENEIPPTCTEPGSRDSVVYCEVCREELSRDHVVTAAKGHSPGEPEILQNVPPTCTEPGILETVSYCTVCGKEADRETVMSAATGHTPAEAVAENQKPASCIEEGQEDSVVYCEVCREELSRKPVILAMVDHTESDPTQENLIEATCTVNGRYDSVVYCSVCHTELSRETMTLFASGHKEDSAVTENRVEATCTAAGHYDTVVYCSVCQEELSRNQVVLPIIPHTAAAAVRENEKAATCTAAGSYDEVVYCSVCHELMSRTARTLAATGHDWGEPVYTWSADNQTVTASRTCRNDPSHTESETVAAGSTVTASPTCIATGSQRFTSAGFSNPAFTVQTRTVTLAKTDHTPGDPVRRENYVDATCTTEGGYDANVIRCTVCNEVLAAEHYAVPALGHSFTFENLHWEDEEPEVCARCGEPALRISIVNGNTFSYTINQDFYDQALEQGMGHLSWGDAGAYAGYIWDEEDQSYNYVNSLGFAKSGYNLATSPSGTVVLDFEPTPGQTVYFRIRLRVTTSTTSDFVYFIYPAGGEHYEYTP